MDSSTQQKMTLVACRLLIISIWVSTLTAPFLVELNTAFTLIGVFEGIIALLLYATVRAELLGRGAPVVVSLALPLMSLPMILISGGVNSPYTYLLPIFPFYATLLMGARFSWVATAIICLLIVPMGVFSEFIVDITQSPLTQESSLLKAYWVIAALVIAAAISTSFNELAENLSKTLREEANMDYLTRVANRRGLEKILEREAHNAKRYSSWLSLVILDIDDFKKFNDSFGHSAGDECLKLIAESLRGSVRVKQDQVGRWGGEEFVIVLPDTDPKEAKSIAELVRREIEFLEGNKREEGGNITATLGCCSAHGGDAKISKMMEVADRALYAGKSRGKNRVVIGRIKEKNDLQDKPA